MWQSFQTLVHEYVHALNHSRNRDYSSKLSKTDAARGHTLREAPGSRDRSAERDRAALIDWRHRRYTDHALRAEPGADLQASRRLGGES
jgi:hypothetical protein